MEGRDGSLIAVGHEGERGSHVTMSKRERERERKRESRELLCATGD